MQESEALQKENAALRAEIEMLRNSTVPVSVLGEVLEDFKSAVSELKLVQKFFETTEQVTRFECWKKNEVM